jgi:vesicle-associated membrane protein 7
MTIVYALVSVGKTVLAEYTATSATGNFPTVTRVLLSKIPSQDGRMSYAYDEFLFHYVVENSICYLCMSDEPNKHRIPYACLQDIKQRFVAQYGLEEPLTANAFAYNEDFSKTLEVRMNFYNSTDAESSVDNIGMVKSQIDEVKSNMVENIEKILERGEKIELLVDKTDRLNQQAFRFESSSRNLRRTMYWRKMRCYAGVGVAVVFLIFIATASLSGDSHSTLVGVKEVEI